MAEKDGEVSKMQQGQHDRSAPVAGPKRIFDRLWLKRRSKQRFELSSNEYLGLILLPTQYTSVHPQFLERYDVPVYVRDVVRLLLAQGVHPDINGYGATALHRACSWGSIRVVRALIDSGRADVNIVDTSFGDKQTPLMKAASADKAGIVALLLAAGADPLRTSARGLTAHEIAVKMGSQQSLRRLLKDHEDWVEPSLVQATVAGHVAIVNELANRLGLPASRREALIGAAKQSGKALRLKEAKSTEMAMLADSKSYVKRILLSPPRSTTCLQETGKQEPADAAQSDCAGKPARKNRLIKLTGNLSRYRRISGTSCVLKKA